MIAISRGLFYTIRVNMRFFGGKMKNIKLKFLSIILCVCMCLTFLSGCSLFVKRETANADEIVMVVGEREITRQELVDAYSSFYQQNYYYFMYYDEDYIMDTFYDSIAAKYMILSEAEKLLKDGVISLSQEDYDDIWKDIFDGINSQIDTKEKAMLLQLLGGDEEKLPKRLQDPEEKDDEEKAYKYEAYEAERVEAYKKETAGTAPKIDDQIKEFKQKGLFTYYDKNEEVEDEKDRTPLYITDSAEKEKRNDAFNKYLADLKNNAKANKEDTDIDAVFKKEIERLYKSYYESALYDEYKEYIDSTVIGTANGEFDNKLSDAEIVKKYRELFNISKEGNSIETNYVSVVTSSSNSSLILYHYNGEFVYFTVQHILVPFSDEVLDVLKNEKGYSTSQDNYFREVYEEIREIYYKKGITEVEGEEQNVLYTTERNDKGLLVKDNGVNRKVTIKEIEEKYAKELQKRLAALESPTEEEKTRVKTLLFQEFAWKYSSDYNSLSNELSGVLGFTISSEKDKNGSWVKDFANGARKLYEAYKANGETNESDDIGGRIERVVSDYGVHLMMLTGVYTAGDVIDLSALSSSSEDGKVSEIVEILKSTYISNLTTETYYDYVYDMIKDSYVGSNGTYFTDYRNQLMKSYKDNNKIEYKNKLSFKTLNDLVS